MCSEASPKNERKWLDSLFFLNVDSPMSVWLTNDPIFCNTLWHQGCNHKHAHERPPKAGLYLCRSVFSSSMQSCWTLIARIVRILMSWYFLSRRVTEMWIQRCWSPLVEKVVIVAHHLLWRRTTAQSHCVAATTNGGKTTAPPNQHCDCDLRYFWCESTPILLVSTQARDAEFLWGCHYHKWNVEWSNVE